MPAVKHVGLFGSLWWRRAAQRNGFDDVLFTDPEDTISEAATANIGLLVGEEIIWPRADRLAGVTMRLIDAARHPHTRTVPVTLGQLADADAVFATNATGTSRAGAEFHPRSGHLAHCHGPPSPVPVHPTHHT